jgi:hypothetical protein
MSVAIFHGLMSRVNEVTLDGSDLICKISDESLTLGFLGNWVKTLGVQVDGW